MSLIPVRADGNWYVLSFGGVTEWARNLRAAGRGELRHKGRTQTFAAFELRALGTFGTCHGEAVACLLTLNSAARARA